MRLCQHAAWVRVIAEALRYPQPRPQITWDNACVVDRFRFSSTSSLKCDPHARVMTSHFGHGNLADFFAKAFPVDNFNRI